jgi:hypothetical protein
MKSPRAGKLSELFIVSSQDNLMRFFTEFIIKTTFNRRSFLDKQAKTPNDRALLKALITDNISDNI